MYSTHFSKRELQCRCGCGLNNTQPELLDLLERVRAIIKAPMIIHSACRCPLHNKAVGGSPKSKHMYGMAADFSVRNMPPEAVLDTILKAYWDGKLPELGGIGLYDTFVHIDTFKAQDGHLRRWDLRKGQ